MIEQGPYPNKIVFLTWFMEATTYIGSEFENEVAKDSHYLRKNWNGQTTILTVQKICLYF